MTRHIHRTGEEDVDPDTNVALGVYRQSLSRVRLFATPWTAARQAPLSMGFSRPEHWSGLPCPPPGDLPDPGIAPTSPALQAASLLSEPPGKLDMSRGSFRS